MEWSEYNQSLVRLGEILLGFDVIDNWHQELQEMNKGKIGEPFRYPNTFLLFFYQKKAKAYFHLPYRQTEGIVKAHVGSKIPSIPDYTTISRRINRLDIKIDDQNQEEKDDYIIVAIDSTYKNQNNKQRAMDVGKVECTKKARLSQNTLGTGYTEQENTICDGK